MKYTSSCSMLETLLLKDTCNSTAGHHALEDTVHCRTRALQDTMHYRAPCIAGHQDTIYIAGHHISLCPYRHYKKISHQTLTTTETTSRLEMG